MADDALRYAKLVRAMHPEVAAYQALASVDALITMGWRPPTEQPSTVDAAPDAPSAPTAGPQRADQAESVPEPTPDPAQTATGDVGRTVAERYAARVEAAATVRAEAEDNSCFDLGMHDHPERAALREAYRYAARSYLDAAGVPDLIAQRDEARAEAVGLTEVIALGWTRSMAATERWRAEDPEARRMVLTPDLGTLLDWLMADADKARAGEAELTAALREANSVRPKMLDAVHDARTQRDAARAERDAAIVDRGSAEAARDLWHERLVAEREEVERLDGELGGAIAERDKARADLGAIGLTLAAVLDVPGRRPATELAKLAAANLVGARGIHERAQRVATSRLAERDKARADLGTIRTALVRVALGGATADETTVDLAKRIGTEMRRERYENNANRGNAAMWRRENDRLVTERDRLRAELTERQAPVVEAARAWVARLNRTGPSRPDVWAEDEDHALIKAVDALDTPARPDGWLAISTPCAPETVTIRVVDGRREMWDPATPPGGWVCAEPGDGPGGRCGMPVESEPCTVHAAATDARMTDADEAALLARQRDAIIALCGEAETAGRKRVRIADIYAAVLHDPADAPTPRPDGVVVLRVVAPPGLVDIIRETVRPKPVAPRTWQAGDPEPGPEVTRVRDRDGDLWKRRQHKGGWRSYTMGVCQWHDGPIGWAPLTDATSEVTG